MFRDGVMTFLTSVKYMEPSRASVHVRRLVFLYVALIHLCGFVNVQS